MAYERWRQPRGEFRPDIGTLVFGILIIGIIGYLLFPTFFKDINNPTVAATSLNNINLPNTTDPSALYSPSPSSQLFPNVNNTMNLGIGNDAMTSGDGVLFVSNGISQQLPVNAQDYAFLQGLFQSDTQGIGAITVFLVQNGQIHQYIVSNETHSILSNLASIKERASKASNTSTYPAPPTMLLPTTAISETLTVNNPSPSGFTVAVYPALDGLTVSNFSLVNSLGNPVALISASTSAGGATYALTAILSAGQTYYLTTTAAGYTFGTAQNVVIP